MMSFFRRILRFLILLMALQTLIVSGLVVMAMRSFTHRIITRELEEDKQKIQYFFNVYGDSWIYDIPGSNLADFFMDTVLTVTGTIRVYNKDYQLLSTIGNENLRTDKRPGERAEPEMTRIHGDQIESVYFKAYPDPPKLLGERSLKDARKGSLFFYFRALLSSLPLPIIIAYWGTKRVTSNFSEIVTSLDKLANGSRDLDFTSIKKTHEMERLHKSTENLQIQLIQKEDTMVHRIQDLTHDLKGPIAGLYNQLEAVELGALELNEDRFKHLYHELGYLNTLIDDMSTLYRLEDNMGEVDIQPINTSEDLMTPLLERYTPEAEEKGIQLYTDIEEQKLIADAVLLNRAVGNLIRNAILYGRGYVVDISVFKEEETDRVIIEIRNKGHIPEKDMPHLFSRYWRKTQDRDGSGLGLPIARMIALKHGGDLTVRNLQPDQVVFQLSLPSA